MFSKYLLLVSNKLWFILVFHVCSVQQPREMIYVADHICEWFLVCTFFTSHLFHRFEHRDLKFRMFWVVSLHFGSSANALNYQSRLASSVLVCLNCIHEIHIFARQKDTCWMCSPCPHLGCMELRFTAKEPGLGGRAQAWGLKGKWLSVTGIQMTSLGAVVFPYSQTLLYLFPENGRKSPTTVNSWKALQISRK